MTLFFVSIAVGIIGAIVGAVLMMLVQQQMWAGEEDDDDGQCPPCAGNCNQGRECNARVGGTQ